MWRSHRNQQKARPSQKKNFSRPAFQSQRRSDPRSSERPQRRTSKRRNMKQNLRKNFSLLRSRRNRRRSGRGSLALLQHNKKKKLSTRLNPKRRSQLAQQSKNLRKREKRSSDQPQLHKKNLPNANRNRRKSQCQRQRQLSQRNPSVTYNKRPPLLIRLKKMMIYILTMMKKKCKHQMLQKQKQLQKNHPKNRALTLKLAVGLMFQTQLIT